MGNLIDPPYIVSWNLTQRCNLSCPHCYMGLTDSELPASNSELTTEEARVVIDELSSLNNSLMLVLSGGEPLLRGDLVEIVEHATRNGLIAVLGTNGTLLTRGNLKGLREAGLKGIGVSVDSTVPKNHDLFRGVDGAWDRSVDALKIAKEEGLETQLDATVTDANWKEVEGFIELGVGLKAKVVNFFFLVCVGRAVESRISTGNYESALKYVGKVASKERRLMVRARCAPHFYRILHEDGFHFSGGTRGCLAGRSYMRIDPKGNVTPCPYMSAIAGNIKEKPLRAIWEDSSNLKLLRTGAYLGRCGLCEYGELCGGCRARAFVETGDLMGEDSLCAYEPSGRDRVVLEDQLESDLRWEEDARGRMKKVPVFMKGMIRRLIESKAREKGVDLITSEFIDEVKRQSHGRLG